MNTRRLRLSYGVLFLLGMQAYGNNEKRLLQSDPNYIHSFEVKLQDLTAKYSDIASKNAGLNAEITKVAAENQQLKQMLANLTSDMAAQNKIITAIQRNNSSGNTIQKVAFDAYTKKSIGHMGRSQVIKYDGIRLNLGNSYNPHTGTFTCDKPGTYVFFFRFLVYPRLSLNLQLVKNGAVIAYLYTQDSTDLARSATMSIVHLQHGDSVWVENIVISNE